MIHLAYDGSLNGDWVARYAIRMAARGSERVLALLHIEDGSVAADLLQSKLAHLGRECADLGVELFPQMLPLERSVLHSLLKALPLTGDELLLCGTRVRSRRRAYLTGTVSEQLLRCRLVPVLAVRVVQPGLLGAPRELLLPLSSHGRNFAPLRPALRQLLPELERLFLLRSIEVAPWRLLHLSEGRWHSLREEGIATLAAIDAVLRRDGGGRTFELDGRIVISDDSPREILVHASRLKSHLILLDFRPRPFPRRLLWQDPLERILRGSPCDVGIFGGP